MNLLAFDTSTEACSAALWCRGEVLSRFEIAPQRHGELILPMIDGLLAEAQWSLAQLDVLGFGRGPGAFTGLRIAAAVAQGIAFANDLPVVPVSTLAAMAQGGWRDFGASHVMVAIDARMGEVYWGLFHLDRNDLMSPLSQETVSAPVDVPMPATGTWLGLGTGWETYHEVFTSKAEEKVRKWHGQRFPAACDILPLARAAFEQGAYVTAEGAQPVYLRDQVVRTGS